MPRRMFDFRCAVSGEMFERYADASLTHCRCECGAEAKRLISPSNVVLEGVTGDFPGAKIKWERKREEKLRQERKQNSQ